MSNLQIQKRRQIYKSQPTIQGISRAIEPGGIKNATHNTLERKPGHGGDKYPAFPPNILWVAFSIPPGALSLVKHPVV
jgi:hypothetical protein